MRSASRLQKDYKFSLFNKGGEKIYKKDSDGNIVYMIVDSISVPIEIGTTPPHYELPISFKASETTTGGEAVALEFGIDTTSYSSIITVSNDLNLPIDEESLIWHEKEPRIDDNGFVDKSSAEYKVAKVSKNIHYTRYLLDKLL